MYGKQCGSVVYKKKKAQKDCECCKEYRQFFKDNEAVRVWVRDAQDNTPVDQPPFGLDGSGVFRIAKLGCDCIVLILLNPAENYTPWRKYVVKCKDIVAMSGGQLEPNGNFM